MDQPVERLDPRDPRTRALLEQRTPSGGYTIGDAAMVRAIRGAGARADQAAVRALCELLVRRCMPEFQRRAWGLRHRPELMEDAIAGMIEQLLREARDPRETFMTLNFIHYLRCLCADNFSRVLRQEGLAYRKDAEGRPAGRPQHVPRALMDRVDPAAEDHESQEAGIGVVVADPRDAFEERTAALEAQRILSYLPDPLDRQIMVLRALEGMRWDDIAALCGKTERTMRLRFEKARARLRELLETETAAAGVV
jgi:RNA polymerase sigma factor (sigma-70 family)